MNDDALDVVLAATWLMMHTLDKYKVESRDNLTCPYMKDLYDALDKMGYIKFGRSIQKIKKVLTEEYKAEFDAFTLELSKSDTSIPEA